MSISTRTFDKLKDGRVVEEITLNNGLIEIRLLTMGANLYSLFVPDKNGKIVDVSLGLSTSQEYIDRASVFGMTIGPVANRVEKGRFVLNGKEYELKTNNCGNTLHSSDAAVQYKLWSYKTEETKDSVSCTLSVVCKDKEGGWPSDREINVKYSLVGKILRIDYFATASEDTYLNLTNHTYFNLTGNASKDVLDYKLTLNTSKYAEAFMPALIPTGRLLDVDPTTDFRTGKKIGYNKPEFGYDHFYSVDGFPEFRKFATVECPESGIKMETWSDLPGFQLFTANTQSKSGIVDKYGNKCCDFCGICLETAYYTDSPNKNWPVKCLFGKDRNFVSRTEYRFV